MDNNEMDFNHITEDVASQLRAWYDAANDAGFLLLRISRNGHNYPPPTGWNIEGTIEGLITPEEAVEHIKSGGNVGVGAWDNCLIVDADNAEKVAAVEREILAGVKTLSVNTPRGRQWLFNDDCEGLRAAGNLVIGSGVELRTAGKAYGMGPGSVRSKESYGEKKIAQSNLDDTWPKRYTVHCVAPVVAVPNARHLLKQVHAEPAAGSAASKRQMAAAFVNGDYTLEEVAETIGGLTYELHGGEDSYKGPCPACGGGSRFCVRRNLDTKTKRVKPGEFLALCRGGCQVNAKALQAALNELFNTKGRVDNDFKEVAKVCADTRLLPSEVIRACIHVAEAEYNDMLREDVVATATKAIAESPEDIDRCAVLYDSKPSGGADLESRLQALDKVVRLNTRSQSIEIASEGSEWREIKDMERLLEAVNERCVPMPWYSHVMSYGKPKRKFHEPVTKKIGAGDFGTWLLGIAQKTQVDPFAEWLDSLEDWDGVPRIESLLGMCFGVEPEYAQAASIALRTTLIGAVARAREPGAKHDTVAILLGEEGIGKSTFWNTLLDNREWFTDHIDLASNAQQQVESILGFVLVECAELVGGTNADKDRLYGFISRKNDTVRLAYRRDRAANPRRCVFVGTTNGMNSIPAKRGEKGRRFIPVAVTGMGATSRACYDHMLETIPRMRKQLWAEAINMYETGECSAIRGDEEAYLEGLVNEHRVTDDAAAEVLDNFRLRTDGSGKLVAGFDDDISMAVLRDWLRSSNEYGFDDRRMGNALRDAGFVLTRKRVGKTHPRLWVKKPSKPDVNDPVPF